MRNNFFLLCSELRNGQRDLLRDVLRDLKIAALTHTVFCKVKSLQCLFPSGKNTSSGKTVGRDDAYRFSETPK